MEFTKADSEDGKYVCSKCIGDEIVSAEIAKVRKRKTCSYCGKKGCVIAIDQIAERVEEVYSRMVGQAAAEPEVFGDSDKLEYRQNGDTPEMIVSEMLNPETDTISEDIVGINSEKNAYSVMRDGGEDMWDSSSDIYVLRIPRDPQTKETWANFCESVKHNRRFFNEKAAQWLHEIMAPLVEAEAVARRSAVRIIQPGDSDSIVYRGRVANSVEDRTRILKDPVAQLGTAPRARTTSGRMNAAGIPVFYGSFDIATCVAELRGPVGGTAVVGKFAISRPLRVLDLTKLSDARFSISYFDPDVERKAGYNRFIRGFHDEIKKAVIPGAETLDYLATQFVAEYLWTRPDPPLDGVIFGSAQTSQPEARNIALFPAASIAHAELRKTSEKPKAERVVAKAGAAVGFDDMFEDISTARRWRPELHGPQHEPALKLVEDGIIIARVAGITYTLDEQSLQIYNAFGEHREDYEDDDDD